MKICVFSDSHGHAELMCSAIRMENPDFCFFLGDGEKDLSKVMLRFPSIPFYAVRGNCDLRSSLSSSLVCVIGGVTIFAAHGHLYNVKYESDFETLTEEASKNEAKVALFGHTHIQFISSRDGMILLNPGSIGNPKKPCYGLLFICNGDCTAECKQL